MKNQKLKLQDFHGNQLSTKQKNQIIGSGPGVTIVYLYVDPQGKNWFYSADGTPILNSGNGSIHWPPNTQIITINRPFGVQP